VKLKQLDTLNRQLGRSKVKCKPIYEDAFTFANYKIGKVSEFLSLYA
jgi:hypothetical protein